MGPLQFTIWKSLFQDIHPGEGAGVGVPGDRWDGDSTREGWGHAGEG